MSPLPSANFLIPALTMARERESPSRLRRGLRAGLIAASTGIIAVVCAAVYWVSSLGPAPLGEGLAFSALVVDRDGKLLRPYATPEGRWRLPATRENVDPRFLQLLLAYEDKRFRTHHGVDPLALGRALVQLITQGRIVSGASTISMQVARLLEPRGARSFKAKLRQMLRAIEIERTLSKDEILALYLSLAPYGGNLEGVRAASLAYFGKEPRRLTLGEAAMLVGLPQSPEQRRPDRSTAAARNARDRVLDRVAAAGIVPFDEIERAKRESVPEGRKPMPILAPHAADAAVAAAPQAKRSSPHDRCGAAEEFGGACARAGPRARA
jgi:penicillin-binding protein 1C